MAFTFWLMKILCTGIHFSIAIISSSIQTIFFRIHDQAEATVAKAKTKQMSWITSSNQDPSVKYHVALLLTCFNCYCTFCTTKGHVASDCFSRFNTSSQTSRIKLLFLTKTKSLPLSSLLNSQIRSQPKATAYSKATAQAFSDMQSMPDVIKDIMICLHWESTIQSSFSILLRRPGSWRGWTNGRSFQVQSNKILLRNRRYL